MVRVLHISDSMNRAGQETFIMNVYRALDREQLQFDFLVFTDQESDYDAEIRQLGGVIHHAVPKGRNLRESMAQVKKIVADNHYAVVHRHYSNASMVFDLLAAKRGGASCLIAHSHNTHSNNVRQHKLLRWPLYKTADWHLACSEDAGEWMFGDRAFQIIPNGIDSERFHFSESSRQSKREELGITPDQLVIGHVGRFNEVKNHSFILKVFHELLKAVPDAVLLLAGDGTLHEETEEQSLRLGISGNVRFLGVRSDIPELMSAMDVFLMPSLYEGLPLTLVEAQAAGLACLVSDVITRDVALTPDMEYLSLTEAPHMWAEKLQQMGDRERKDTREAIRQSGYDVKDVAVLLSQIYLRAAAEAEAKASGKAENPAV